MEGAEDGGEDKKEKKGEITAGACLLTSPSLRSGCLFLKTKSVALRSRFPSYGYTSPALFPILLTYNGNEMSAGSHGGYGMHCLYKVYM